MRARRSRPQRLSLIERALIEKEWHDTAVRAQIHAILGDDGHQFVNAAGRVLYVVLGALAADEVDGEVPEGRIIRGACNALYEQAGRPDIDDTRRASISAGLQAAERLLPALRRGSLIEAACELKLKLRFGHVNWTDFQQVMEGAPA